MFCLQVRKCEQREEVLFFPLCLEAHWEVRVSSLHCWLRGGVQILQLLFQLQDPSITVRVQGLTRDKEWALEWCHWVEEKTQLYVCPSASFCLLHLQWWSVSRCLRHCQTWHLCLSAEHLVVSENRCGLVEQSVATTFLRSCFDFGGFYQLSKCHSVSLRGYFSELLVN